MDRNKFPGSPLPGLLDDYLDTARIEFEHITHVWGESPIEACFLGALLAGQWAVPVDDPIWLEIDVHAMSAGITHNPRFLEAPNSSDYCVSQAEMTVGGRAVRVDFAFLSTYSRARFVVELDGHEFHERTKEQARKDKSRDRLLTAAGWQVLRFTGSEIWKDPVACVCEVEKLLKSVSEKEHAERMAARRPGQPRRE